MNKRPTTFVEWRALWHEEAKILGWSAAHNYDPQTGRVRMTRYMHKQIQRVLRIGARLDVELEVMDASFCTAFMQMVRDYRQRKDIE